MKYLVIHNPGSKGGTSARRSKELLACLMRKGIECEYRTTATLDDALSHSEYGNRHGFDVIIAAGGDGTINRVLNGFFDSNGRRISGAKLGIIYTGTSPDFCKSYGIPLKMEKAAGAIARGQSIKIKVGMITHAKKTIPFYDSYPVPQIDDNFTTSFFACCANIGLGAALARKANSGIRKRIGDVPGTFVSFISCVREYTPTDFLVRCDGELVMFKKLTNLSVGITPYIASGIRVKNDLTPEDERFYNMTATDIRLSNLAGAIWTIYSGREIRNPNIALTYSNEIEVFGNSNSPAIEFDGDPYGYLPCKINMARDQLDVIIGR